MILGLRGVILGLRGVILGQRGVILGQRGVILGLKELYWAQKASGGGTYGQTDIRDGSPLCPTGHRPFGAAAQKGDRPTDQRTDKAGYRVA